MAVSNIKKVKPNYFDGLKKLVSYVVKPKLTKDELTSFLDQYKLDNTIIKRLLTMVYNMPSLIIYFNKYMNNLYLEPDLVDFIFSFRYVLQANNSLYSKYIHYHKSNVNKFPLQLEIMELFKKYFETRYNLYLNYHELKFLYQLFLVGHITQTDVIDIDLLVNNNQRTIKIDDDFQLERDERDKQTDITVQELINNQNKLPGFLIDYNGKLQQLKNDNCNNCKLLNNKFINIDGNISHQCELDLMIINLFSNNDDLLKNKILTPPNLVRTNIDLFPSHINWMFINQICCCSKNKSELGKNAEVSQLIESCGQNIVNTIISDFPSRKYVIIGEELFNKYIKSKYSDFEYNDYIGTKIDNYFIFSDNTRNQTHKQKNEKLWSRVQEYLRAPREKITQIKSIKANDSSKKESGKLYLLSVKELSNDVILMIYTDENGNKVYRKEKYKMTAYLKTRDFKECDIITDQVDQEFSMTKLQKTKLNNLLRNKTKELKDNS